MSERRTALFAIVVTVLFWGLSFISTKVAVSVLPPMSLGAARFALAVLFLTFVKHRIAPDEKLDLRDLPYLAGAGLIGVTAYFYFENTGILFVSASEASIIIAAIPVISMVVERFTDSIKSKMKAHGDVRPVAPAISLRRWAGAALSMIGVWLVAGATVTVSGSAKGYLYMFGAAVSWVAYCFLTRPLFAGRSRIYIVYWQSIFGFLGFLPFAVLEVPRWGRLDLAVVLHVAYLGVCCSALGYWFYARALQILGVATATVFVNLIPVIAVAAGYVFLGDRLAPVQWAGAAAVLAGVYFATLEGERRRT
jgi:drug/metabolite transporter (DMT)-like permease